MIVYSRIACGVIDILVVAQTWDITIVEHPSSLVVPVNATAVFSCTARCTPSPCDLMGQWLVNDTFITDSIHHSCDNLSMILMLNTSNASNGSKVRCYFDLNEIFSINEHEDSEIASLILMDGELQSILGHSELNVCLTDGKT